MNPIIKFTTLFGLLAVELAIEMTRAVSLTLAAVFLALSVVFVWRSFYSMRIGGGDHGPGSPRRVRAGGAAHSLGTAPAAQVAGGASAARVAGASALGST